MKWKKFFVMSAALIFINTPASAQIVTVQGSGMTEDAAIKDAKRVAVERVVGARIQSESLTVNYELVFDAVQSRAQGYVTSCEVVKKISSGRLVEITARVNVSDEPNSALMKDIEMVMTLNDPRLAVTMDYYGDGGETLKKYPAMCAAAIREELLKRGFTHVVDGSGDADFFIVGRLSVEKAREVKLPSWRNIGGDEFKLLDTGLSRSVTTLDCKIKKVATDEIVGEFQARGDGLDATGNEIPNQSVTLMASSAAEQVRGILSREASKVFSSVKIFVKTNDGDKVLLLEEILHQTQGVDSVYVRDFKGGQCIIDAGTNLTPQNLYRVLEQAAGDSLPMQMTGFSSVTLEISLR